MKVIGIDPGPEQSAMVIAQFNPFKLLGIGQASNHEVADKLATITDVDCAGIEFIQSYGKPVGASVYQTAFWGGRFAEVLNGFRAIPFSLVPASKWRSHLTQCARNTDATVRQALRIRFGDARKGQPLEGIKRHLWDALGVAVYVADGEVLGGWQG